MFTPAVLVNRATSLLMTICLLKSVSIFPGLGWLKLDVAELLKNKSIKVPLVIYQALNLRLPGSINLQPNLYKNMFLLQMKARKNQAVYTVRVNLILMGPPATVPWSLQSLSTPITVPGYSDHP